MCLINFRVLESELVSFVGFLDHLHSLVWVSGDESETLRDIQRRKDWEEKTESEMFYVKK